MRCGSYQAKIELIGASDLFAWESVAAVQTKVGENMGFGVSQDGKSGRPSTPPGTAPLEALATTSRWL